MHRAGGEQRIKATLKRPAGWWDDATTCDLVDPIATHPWYTRAPGTLPRFASIELPPEAMKKLMDAPGRKLQIVIIDVTDSVTDSGSGMASC